MKKIWILFLSVWILAAPVDALDLEKVFLQESGTAALEDGLPSEAREVLKDYDFLGTGDVDSLMVRLGEEIGRQFQKWLTGAARSAVVMLVIVTLCSLVSAFFPNGQAPGYVTIGGVLAIVTAVITDSDAFIQQGVETLYRLKDFSGLLLPCLAGAAAAGGATVSAGAKYGAAMLFMHILLTVCVDWIAPLISVYLACVIGRAAFESNAFTAMANLVKWVCLTALTLLVVVFTAYLSISGLISASGDQLTTRFTRAAISTALPVVGKMVSDAAATVVAGMGLVRNSIGIFGAIAVVCVGLTPFISMGLRYLLFKAAAAAASIFPDQRFSALIDGIGTAFGMMIAMTGTGVFMILISIISLLKVVGG